VVTAAPAAPTVESGLSIAQLSLQIERAIDAAFPSQVLVYGVLSSVKIQGERVYLELSERGGSDARLRGVIWRNARQITEKLRSVGFTLEPDLDVMFQVVVGFNKRQGSASLEVVDVVPEYTVGKLAAKREVTNKRLQSEGLFLQNKQRTLPFLPRRLGILTSSGGTVINDFLAPLHSIAFGFELVWLPVQVQGSDAVRSIVAGIERLSQDQSLDALLLFRGGGSPSELAVFSEYEVARAICLCPLPVLSAIGHQEDQSSAQDVSFRAFGVPKDLGHFLATLITDFRTRVKKSGSEIRTLVAAEYRRIEERVRFLTTGLTRSVEELLTLRQTVLERVTAILPFLVDTTVKERHRALSALSLPLLAQGEREVQGAEHLLTRVCEQAFERSSSRRELIQERFLAVTHRVVELLGRRFSEAEGAVQRMEERVTEASPETQLRRGFTIVRSGGSLVLSGEAIQSQTEIEIQFFDCQRKATVQ
jgi:exodeoxyribonuclease VII large subunit